MSPSHHKARRRRKAAGDTALDNSPITSQDASSGTSKPAFPLASFLWPARKSTSQWVILPLILMAVGLFRWTVGFWGYSGESILQQVISA